MDIPACTFGTARTVFVELFCKPKSLMENPSLRVSGHVSSMNRTFFVEDFTEDEFGQRDKDEVPGEQGYVDDERSCFWTWDDTECAWQSRQFKGRQVKRRRGKGKGKKAKDDPKGPEEHALVMNKRKISNGGKKKTQFGGPKERKARRACQKAMMFFHMGGFRPYQTKVQARTPTKTKAEERIKKEKARKELFLNPDSQPQKHLMNKDMARPGNQTIGLPVIGLTIPEGGWWQPH